MPKLLKILLIEDDEVDRLSLIRYCESKSLPYEIRCAESVNEAKRILAEETFDLVLSDYKLRDGNLFDFLDELESQPVILITGTGSESIAVEALTNGVQDYLIKDADWRYLDLLPHRVKANRQQWEANRKIVENEEQLRALFDVPGAMRGVLELTEEDLVQVVANRSAADALGETQESIRGKKISDLNVSREEIDLWGNQLLESARIGQPVTFEFLRGVEPNQRWYSTTVNQLGNSENGLLRFGYISTDVTARKQAELALMEQREYLEMFLHSTGDSVWNWDMQSNFVERSDGFLRAFGYPPLEVDSGIQWWVDRVHPDDRARVLKAFDKAVAERSSKVQYAYRFLRNDGSYAHVDDHVCIVYDAAGKARRSLGAMIDVSELKAAEVQRHELEQQVQHAQKLESLGVLAGGIAHDFNNLLTTILGNACLADRQVAKDSKARDFINQVILGAKRAAELTEQLMAYAGHRQTESGLVDINAVVDDLQRLLSISISKKCFLELKLEKNLPLIEGSTTQLRQVLMNLVINASEAIGESGGTIRVVTGSQMCGQTDLAIALVGNTLPVGNYVFLEVSDTGSGMSEETRMKIFDPFYTTKFAGRGLGMATVLGIARRHMAAIKLTSELGKGSTFRVLFPASTRAALVTGPKAAVSEEWRSSGTVLIVDDEKPVVELTSMMMKEMGFKVISARDGRDGVDRFRDHSNEIDLVLMDMTMPRLDGEQAFREMQTIRTGVPAVLLSGFSTKITMNGFSAFLQKPFSFGELVSTVRKVMEKETNPG